MPIALLLALGFMPLVVDREARHDEWGYRPAEGALVELNPPALSWPAVEGATSYTVQLATDASFQNPITVEKIPWSVYTHRRPLSPGVWRWRYRPEGGPWSKARSFTISPDAVEFPQPGMEQLRMRIPKSHPRLFVRAEDRGRLRALLAGEEGRRLMARAEALLASQPTPEPTVRASAKDPATNQYWWSNRVQTVKALQEAEVLSFVWWLTGEAKYREAARRFTLQLAAWDPDGPTNFTINCEAAKPMLHRLARAYDWAYDAFSEEERARIRAVLLRRAMDAWMSWEVGQGRGHLNQPYGSHANRTWHKLAENAIATFGETPEAEKFLDYAVTKFFAAYPVWADDDGGWHEGLAYFAGYMSKAAWWFDIARSALGIDGFRKPFFRHFGDYALYSAPPGSPDMGFGDLSFRPVSQSWSFMHFFVNETQNPYWAWWVRAWNIKHEPDEPVLGFLWSARPQAAAKAPADLYPSKVFRGTGVAVLNTTLMSAADNVQVRFKSSPMGNASHGHDPHNAFTFNAYGAALLVNNVYRDLHGSPFHTGWCWSTRAQNAVLIDGKGQKPHSPDPSGRLVKWEFQEGVDYVAGEAAAAYEGRAKRFLRHVLLVKPDLVLLVDELEAARPATFQWMLHGQDRFAIDEGAQRLRLERPAAGVLVDYIADEPFVFRQWTGYEPEPDHRYLASINSPGIPPQWHVEASTVRAAPAAYTVTVLRPYRAGARPAPLEVRRSPEEIVLRYGSASVVLHRKTGEPFASVQRQGREWRVAGAAR